ncbi:MAG: sigma-54-dependent Fis family transcriptional regulator, partial [Gammaproteobacteria bacterium]|nr:sigma-54-dependent Fis family transcriptional regulator [Gammaproteobacteria bacterium]
DDDSMLRILQLLLQRAGYGVITARSAGEGLLLSETCGPSLAILDWKLPDMTGLEMLRRLKVSLPHLPVILLTGFANLEGAVSAIKEGAYDYLAKPMKNEGLLGKVREALGHESRPLPANVSRDPLTERMGTSTAITRTIEDIERVSPTDFSVNLFGETGAGKEVVARAIHDASPRANRPFVAVDCGAIPESLIENELFGHERGAFTGADRQQAGRFEAAEGGTLFLDEITNLSLSAQARLLRVLQERVIYRVGGSTPIPVDVRLISASNRKLAEAVSEGGFRADLLYRLSDYRIAIPPLRERQEDITHIANQFLVDANRELGKQIAHFTDKAVQAMLRHPWPGNVRELRSVVRRAVLIAQHAIDVHHLDLPESELQVMSDRLGIAMATDMDPDCEGHSLKEIVRTRVERLEREVLLHALRRHDGNKAAVARMLQVDYKTVHTKLKAYGLAG